MTRRFGAAQRDRVLALLAGAVAVGFIIAARGIEDSLLSDSVGAGGVPQGVGITMAVAALALFAKSLLEGRQRTDAEADETPADTASPAQPSLSRNSFVLRTIGLVLILCAYAVLLPLIGYPVSIGLLVLSAGWLAGAPLRAPLLLTAAVAGPLMWGLFGFLLQVRMPAGSWWG